MLAPQPLAAALILLVSNQGHWFGEHPGVIEVRWAAETPLPDTNLVWRLEFAGTELAGGRMDFGSGEAPTRITVTPPKVRVRTDVRWTCRVQRKSDGGLISEAETLLHIYPDDLLEGVARRLGGTKPAVWDTADGLPAILKQAGVSFSMYDAGYRKGGDLRATAAPIILVGPDQLGESPFDQNGAIHEAEAGASVLILEQRRPRRLAGYPLAARPRPPKLDWRFEHPLLAGIGTADAENWLVAADADLHAVRLPANEPALEVVFWPPAGPSAEPASIDALLVVKRLGAGRLVLSQVPLGSWLTDPRAQIFLRNAMDYLATPPEPTPPPSQRPKAATTAPADTHVIPVSPGVNP